MQSLVPKPLKLKTGLITACYNNAKFIPECFSAIFAQSVKPDIVVFIDDCSTDDSWGEVQRFLYADPSCKPVFEHDCFGYVFLFQVQNITIAGFKLDKNGGPAVARNIGLKYLLDKVDVIGIADCDDVYYPTKIEKTLEIFKKYPQVALVYSDYDTENTTTGKTQREFKECYSYRRLFEECIVSNNSFFPATIIGLVGFYDETLRGPEDYDMWLRIGEKASVYHIPESLYKYRIHGSNITVTTPSEKFAKQVHYVKQKAMKRAGGNV